MTTGLILVDIQKDYFHGGKMELVGMKEASEKASELLFHFREKGMPTFHIQHIARNANASFFLPNTEGAELHETIEPLPDEPVVQKHYPNSFKDTNLADSLQRAQIKRVVICGAMSHMCIDATTRAAADLGFECVLTHDACATRDLEFNGRKIPAREVHGAFMAALGWAYAKAVTVNEFVAHPET
jgi:nicotinamidase-related amidase